MLTREERYGADRANAQWVVFSQELIVRPNHMVSIEVLHDPLINHRYYGRVTIAKDRITIKSQSPFSICSEIPWILREAIKLIPTLTQTLRGNIYNKDCQQITLKPVSKKFSIQITSN